MKCKAHSKKGRKEMNRDQEDSERKKIQEKSKKKRFYRLPKREKIEKCTSPKKNPQKKSKEWGTVFHSFKIHSHTSFSFFTSGSFPIL